MEQKLIPGVFNYCNRWCERCALAHRCMLRISELEMENEFDDPEDDLPDLSFEMDVQDSDEHTDSDEVIEFVPEFEVEEPGPDAMSAMAKRKEEMDRMSDENASVKEAQLAGELIEIVLQRGSSLLAKEAPVSTEGLTYHQQQKVEGEAHRIQNLMDILGWYRYMLQVKTMRAVSGKSDEDELDDPIQNDSNGSAKVIMIGANHCTKAAQGLITLLPALEGELLLLLSSLQKYLKLMEEDFPDAMKFIRPGFDTLNITEDLGA